MRNVSTRLFVAALVACGGRAGEQETENTPVERETVSTSGDDLDLPGPAAFAREHADVASYWYQGVAELSRYQLSQQRYGSAREGDAVLIFVTEPFLLEEQVKHEADDGKADTSVLKLNAYRRFDTGIYPYSLLTSTFGRVDTQGAPLKVTASVTEWCGQAFMQMNARDDRWQTQLRSYFQNEGDQDRDMPVAPVEDAIFIRGRFGADSLPVGELSIIPALHYLRLAHQPLQPYSATGEVSRVEDERYGDGALVRYELVYSQLGRTLVIFFDAAFPFDVKGWEEHQQGQEGVTRAVRTHAVLTDYWNHNGAQDDDYRRALGMQ